MSISPSPPSSLLHLSRPPSLRSKRVPQHQLTIPDPGSSKSRSSSGGDARSLSSSSGTSNLSPSSLLTDSSTSIPSGNQNAVASSSEGLKYLNMSLEQTQLSSPNPSDVEGDQRSGASPRSTETSAHILGAYADGAIGLAVPKSRWQPDCSSALCSFPCCTALFAPPENRSYFALYNRRHHCRLCGLLFCSEHTSQRAPVTSIDANGHRVTAEERVCDICLPRVDGDAAPSLKASPISRSRSRSSHAHSRRASMASQRTDSTRPSDHIVTPLSEDPAPLVSEEPLLNSSLVLPRVHDLGDSSSGQLAPIQSWMDPSGILSLYPLAVNPSHSRCAPTSPSAPPLFGASNHRNYPKSPIQSLHQRRKGKEAKFWIPEKWGYKREEFDLTYHQDSDGDSDAEEPGGGIVVDGPIRYRASARRIVTPAHTPRHMSRQNSAVDVTKVTAS